MKPASSVSNSATLTSSPDVVKPGPTVPEFATAAITSAARSASGEDRPNWMSSGLSPLSSMKLPPADSSSALNHTMRDSDRRPWALTSTSCDAAASTIWSQVTGWLMSRPAASATDWRYQRSWVFAQKGIATSSPSQVDACRAPPTPPSLTRSPSPPAPGRPLQSPLDHALADPLRDVVGHGGEEARLGELRWEDHVQAHDVDRLVVGREPADQLLTLGGRVAGELCHVDPVGPVRRLGTPLRDRRLAAGIGVDVPRQGRCAAVPSPAAPRGPGRGQGRARRRRAPAAAASCSRR